MTKKCIFDPTLDAIENSHVVPRFIAKRLKAGSPAKWLWDSESGKVQDSWKGAWVSGEFEQVLSRWENYFASKLYVPFLNTKALNVNYTESLWLFLASLHARLIKHTNHLERHTGKDMSSYDQLFEACRSGVVSQTPSNAVHLYLTFHYPITNNPAYVPGVNTFLREAIYGELYDWIIPGSGPSIMISYVSCPFFSSFATAPELDAAYGSNGHLIHPCKVSATGTFTQSQSNLALLDIAKQTINKISEAIQNNHASFDATTQQRIADWCSNDTTSRARESWDLDMQALANSISNPTDDSRDQ